VIELAVKVGSGEEFKADDVVEVGKVDLPPGHQLGAGTHARRAAGQVETPVNGERRKLIVVGRRLHRCLVGNHALCTVHNVIVRPLSTVEYMSAVSVFHRGLIHDLLFLPISTIESAVGKRLITHCCVSRLACSRLSGHIEPHSPDFKREINTTTTVMN